VIKGGGKGTCYYRGRSGAPNRTRKNKSRGKVKEHTRRGKIKESDGKIPIQKRFEEGSQRAQDVIGVSGSGITCTYKEARPRGENGGGGVDAEG